MKPLFFSHPRMLLGQPCRGPSRSRRSALLPRLPAGPAQLGAVHGGPHSLPVQRVPARPAVAVHGAHQTGEMRRSCSTVRKETSKWNCGSCLSNKYCLLIVPAVAAAGVELGCTRTDKAQEGKCDGVEYKHAEIESIDRSGARTCETKLASSGDDTTQAALPCCFHELAMLVSRF